MISPLAIVCLAESEYIIPRLTLLEPLTVKRILLPWGRLTSNTSSLFVCNSLTFVYVFFFLLLFTYSTTAACDITFVALSPASCAIGTPPLADIDAIASALSRAFFSISAITAETAFCEIGLSAASPSSCAMSIVADGCPVRVKDFVASYTSCKFLPSVVVVAAVMAAVVAFCDIALSSLCPVSCTSSILLPPANSDLKSVTLNFFNLPSLPTAGRVVKSSMLSDNGSSVMSCDCPLIVSITSWTMPLFSSSVISLSLNGYSNFGLFSSTFT